MMLRQAAHRSSLHTSILSLLFSTLVISGASLLDAGHKLSVKGVQPELAAKYSSTRGSFDCFSGGPSITFDRVNDDFCDCIDGSDEPGTSACPLGKFYCRNRAHTPKLLNSSSVDDGFCDCCDGSDENSGKCPNTCAEAGAASRAALKARATALKQGLKNREKYVSKAVMGRSEWQQELAKVSQEAEGLQRVVSRLQAKKERIDKEEAKEREAQEKFCKQKEEEEAAKKAAKPVAADKPSDPAQEESVAAQPPDATVSEPAEGTEEAAVEGLEQEIADVEAKVEEEEELSVEEQGRRIASQWTNDPEASGHAKEEAASTGMDTGEAQQAAVPEAGALEPAAETPEGVADLDYEAEEEDAAATPRAGLAARLIDWANRKLVLGLGGSTTALAGRQAVKDAYTEKNGRLTELTQRKAELEGKLKTDFGPSDAFLTLADRCFEAKVEKYVYEVCPFGAAAQKDGGMSTSLGSWQGFEDGYKAMVFKNGQGCWSGPNRSIRVEVECGAKEEVWEVVEPNRCEYQARMATPAACSHEEAKSVQDQIAAVERELAAKDEL